MASQRLWDDGIADAVAMGLRVNADQITLARLLASTAIGSGAWLNALPSAALGLNLDNNALQVEWASG